MEGQVVKKQKLEQVLGVSLSYEVGLSQVVKENEISDGQVLGEQEEVCFFFF